MSSISKRSSRRRQPVRALPAVVAYNVAQEGQQNQASVGVIGKHLAYLKAQ
jgi:hypothetical protein